MNILFLTVSTFDSIKERGIYSELVAELIKRDHQVYVISPHQKRENKETELNAQDNVKILQVKTGNITSTKSLIEKGISTLMIEKQYLEAIKKYFPTVQFDMVMYSTPPITFNKVIKYFKKKHNSLAYLMLKDIFPQNAVDIGLMKENGLLHKFFRKKEIELYKQSDMIGAMSQGNVDYILQNNDFLSEEKLEVFPNAIMPLERKEIVGKDQKILKKYNIPVESTLFVYGGNLGKPQGIDFLLEIMGKFYQVENGHLLVVGNGTEFEKIERYIEKEQPKNVSLFERIPKEEYDKFLASADVGLILLDHRFTIPNFPSRLTSYMESSLPVIAATDKNTDLKDVLIESESGFWSESIHISEFIDNANKLSINEKLRHQMGLAGRKYLEENYDVRKTVDILLKHL